MHEDLAFAEHEVLVGRRDASETIELYVRRWPLDRAVARPMKVYGAHCALRERRVRARHFALPDPLLEHAPESIPHALKQINKS